jgi:hypothetical protein
MQRSPNAAGLAPRAVRAPGAPLDVRDPFGNTSTKSTTVRVPDKAGVGGLSRVVRKRGFRKASPV